MKPHSSCKRFEKIGLTSYLHEAECADCSAQRESYDRLIGAFQFLPKPRLGRAWEERVRKAIEAPPPARSFRLSVWWLAPVAVAAAALLLVWMRTAPTPAMAIRTEVRSTEDMRGRAPAIGDTLVFHAQAGGKRNLELRVYRDDDALVMRCPGQNGCRTTKGGLTGELTVRAPGRYRALLIASDRLIPASQGHLDPDTRDALKESARIELSPATSIY